MSKVIDWKKGERFTVQVETELWVLGNIHQVRDDGKIEVIFDIKPGEVMTLNVDQIQRPKGS